LGNRHQGLKDQMFSRRNIYEAGKQRDRRVVTRSLRPLAGCYLTGPVEPCGALPRKCLFIYLFTTVVPKHTSVNGCSFVHCHHFIDVTVKPDSIVGMEETGGFTDEHLSSLSFANGAA
jgi:hypothetical protein